MKLKHLGVFTLAMFITGGIDSIRNLPAAALFGSTLIFFFIFAAVLFLIPTALVSAELSSTYTEKSGFYHWVRMAWGNSIGFLAIWLQWINTLIWYPTILSFIAGTLAYLIDPKLAQNKIYLVSVILVTFWCMTLVNLKGLKTSARFASFCTVVGMIVPMILIMVLGATWFGLHKPLQIHLTSHNLVPTLHHSGSWIALTAMMTSFLGMELATVHVKGIHAPQKTFPKALMISVSIILVTMIFGSLVIAFVLPKGQINLVDGVMQIFSDFFKTYHMGWCVPIITLLILIGSVGGMTNWIISPAKGLLQSAQTGFLPKFFCHENKHGVASRLLMTQAILVSVVCLAFLLMPSVNGSYWLLTDLSTQLYLLMYMLMFFSAIRLKVKFPKESHYFKIPFGHVGMLGACLLGLLGCVIAIMVGFIPPDNINVGGAGHYELLFSGGMLLMVLPAGLLMAALWLKRHKCNRLKDSGTSLAVSDLSIGEVET